MLVLLTVKQQTCPSYESWQTFLWMGCFVSITCTAWGAVLGAVEAVWDADGRFLGALEAVLGRTEDVRAPPLHEKMHVLVCTLLESFRPLPVGASLWHKSRDWQSLILETFPGVVDDYG